MGADRLSARHILSYAQTLDGGGIERALLRLAGGWIAAGRQVTLAIGDASGPLAAELPADVALVPLGGGRLRNMLALPGIVRRAAPDVIFCPGNHYTGLAAWTKLRLGSGCPPIVGKLSNAVRRGDHPAPIDAVYRLWLGAHGRFLDHLVAMTPGTVDTGAAAMRMGGRTSVIPNPPAVVRGEPIALPTRPVILGVGRLVPQKRWDRLVVAVAELGDVPLVILGEGPLRARLLSQAAALGVRLSLPGHVTDPLATMARVSLVALTSDYEGVPGVLREALSVGTPVVTTDSTPAAAEIVASSALGSVVARDDRAGLVAALSHWLGDAPRPAPVPQPGEDSARRYLAVFDAAVAARLRPPAGALQSA